MEQRLQRRRHVTRIPSLLQFPSEPAKLRANVGVVLVRVSSGVCVIEGERCDGWTCEGGESGGLMRGDKGERKVRGDGDSGSW